jgi:hypothetical protein
MGLGGAFYGICQIHYFAKYPDSIFKEFPLLQDNYPIRANFSEVWKIFNVPVNVFHAIKVVFSFDFWINALSL